MPIRQPVEPPRDHAVLEGMISIWAALAGRSRPVFRILANTAKLPKGIRRLETLARSMDIPFERCGDEGIDGLARGRSHGGVVAEVGDRRTVGLEMLLGPVGVPFLVVLEGVEDPYNFGAAIRSLYAAGSSGLILGPRNWMSAASVVARSSAGASELIPTAIAANLEAAVGFFGEHGLSVVALDAMGDRSLYDVELTRPLLLLIGGERRGLKRSFARERVLNVKIPYGRPESHSLGTAACAAVVGFEVMRQRSAALGV